uniref:Serine peptidase inhibitor, clade B, member 3A n=1 Tax=Castor canadensis TaxID=51338 RepID=A0A250YH19_CASCN|nr:serpin B4-like [Castor canadensis]
MNSLSEANTKFMLDLFQQLKKPEKNFFCSPLSISSALSMLLLGAQGNTGREIEKVLHISENTKQTTKRATSSQVEKSGNVHHQFQKLMTELNKPTDAYEMKIANGLFGEKTFQFLQEYVENTKKFYLANVEPVDFLEAAEESRKKINSWVEKQTNEKIKDLFPKDSFNNSIVLVLVNAIYFKGLWDQQFKKEYTEEMKFWLNKKISKPVQMMSQTNHFKFAFLEDVQAKILEIPYKGKDLSMTVLLPNEVDGLQKLEDKLTAEKLIEWTNSQNMHLRKVDLNLPRFKMEEGFDLKEALEHMGMVDAFSQHADLSGISDKKSLTVSKVLHKSFVEVTEEGTEAAAASGIVTGFTSSAPQTKEKFCCDHPFIFFIKENKTNTILFFGRLSTP